MARRERRAKIPKNNDRVDAVTEIFISEEDPRGVVRRKNEMKMELVNKQEKMTPVGRNASRTIKSNSAGLKSSSPKSTRLTGGIGDNLQGTSSVESAGDGNSKVPGGNSGGRASFITRPLFSYSMLLVLILFCVVPMIEVSYQVPVPYQDIETYTEQEPYADTVYYSEKQPYTTTQAYVVSQPYTVPVPYVVYPHPAPPPPTTNNITPPYPPLPPQPQVYYRDVTRYMDVTQYKDVTQYQDVQKTRNETKFRTVQKQRTVTRVGMETRYKVVPILYYLMSYQD